MAKKQTKGAKGQPVVFDMSDDQCVWSRAGVVEPMKCINAFNCLGCAYDKKVQGDFEKAEIAAGRTGRQHNTARMRLLMSQRKCRHMLSGFVSVKYCSHGFDCAKCPYDQRLEDTNMAHPYSEPVVDWAGGFAVGRDHYYYRGHSWARLEYGGRVRVGVDDFAMRLLGPQDQIKLPGLGQPVQQKEPLAVLKREDHTAEIKSPLDGRVVAVNAKVLSDAGAAHDSPYGGGWLMVIQPTKLRGNLKNLLFGQESLSWMDDEAGRLSALLADETGYQLAASGGEVIGDIYGAAPQVGWDHLCREFLG